jgi:hypothetical protein
MHAARQGDIADLQDNVDMVGHGAKGVNPIAKSAGSILKQKVETAAVGIVQKEILPAVSPETNMIHTS